jgi:tripartite-type tricarboxylate transporter receptor subunit TctC
MRTLLKQLSRATWLLSALVAGSVVAQQYPDRPIKLIVPFSPGSSSDSVGRYYAGKLETLLKQPVLVENRAGAGGAIGVQAAIASPTFFKTLNFDFSKELTPVSLTHKGEYVLVVPASLPARSAGEFIGYAKANAGKLFNGHAAPITLMLQELFKQKAGIALTAVPYKTDAQISQAMLANEAQMVMGGFAAFRPLVEAGKLRLLATTGPARMRDFPDVPTMEEIGLKDLTITWTSGVWAPAKTPRPVVDLLSRQFSAIARMPETETFLARTNGAAPVGSTPEEYGAAVQRELAFWAAAAKIANYTPE